MIPFFRVFVKYINKYNLTTSNHSRSFYAYTFISNIINKCSYNLALILTPKIPPIPPATAEKAKSATKPIPKVK